MTMSCGCAELPTLGPNSTPPPTSTRPVTRIVVGAAARTCAPGFTSTDVKSYVPPVNVTTAFGLTVSSPYVPGPRLVVPESDLFAPPLLKLGTAGMLNQSGTYPTFGVNTAP